MIDQDMLLIILSHKQIFVGVMGRAHQTRRSGRLLRLGFNEIAQCLAKSEVL